MVGGEAVTRLSKSSLIWQMSLWMRSKVKSQLVPAVAEEGNSRFCAHQAPASTRAHSLRQRHDIGRCIVERFESYVKVAQMHGRYWPKVQ